MRFLVAVLLFFSLPTSLRAGEIIRIAVIENTSRVVLTSRNGFLVKTSSGVKVGRPLASAEIGIQKGITINRRDSLEKELLFIPSPGERLVMNQTPYEGIFRIKRTGESLLVTNEVELERYLQGVVPAEMPPDWEAEALKAQAVISRTYALYKKKENFGKGYDLAGSVLGQVYKGAVADPRTSASIEQTRGMVLTYGGEVALTFFHSTSAGPTEDASERWNIDLPYLKGVSCPLDRDSPYFQWERTITLRDLEEGLRKSGYPVRAVATLTPLQWSRAGRLLTVRILHDDGEIILKAEELRKALGFRILPSTHFAIDSFGREIHIRGNGYGHGVGLCQWGANVMAQQGLKFEEILLYYYPGVTLKLYEEIK
jgi:stage II sporulation protein D